MPQNAWALTYTMVMGLCRLAYSDSSPNGQGKTFRIGLSNWTITCIDNQGGFRSITAKGLDINKKSVKVVSFSGSDMEWNDWLWDGNFGTGIKGAEYTQQYQCGLHVAQREKPDYLLGHSLGGGISNYCSLLTGIRSITINPAPVIAYFGFNTKINTDDKYGKALNYCVDYEGLSGIRNAYFDGMPGKRVSVESATGPLSPVAKHKLSYLYGFIEPIEKR